MTQKGKKVTQTEKVSSSLAVRYSKDSIAFQSWVQKTQLLLGSKDSKESKNSKESKESLNNELLAQKSQGISNNSKLLALKLQVLSKNEELLAQ